jgi:hypothetical protein
MRASIVLNNSIAVQDRDRLPYRRRALVVISDWPQSASGGGYAAPRPFKARAQKQRQRPLHPPFVLLVAHRLAEEWPLVAVLLRLWRQLQGAQFSRMQLFA